MGSSFEPREPFPYTSIPPTLNTPLGYINSPIPIKFKTNGVITNLNIPPDHIITDQWTDGTPIVIRLPTSNGDYIQENGFLGTTKGQFYLQDLSPNYVYSIGSTSIPYYSWT